MDLGRILKWLVLIAIVAIVWKVVLPRLSERPSVSKGTDDSCVDSAQRASNAWGGGIGQFVNPPYDLDAWSSFRSDVERKISAAESDCGCADEQCVRVRSAMTDLRSLVRDLDQSIRNGSPPPDDAVQRQESIDNRIR